MRAWVAQTVSMAKENSKLRALWDLSAGQRRRYLLAAIAMAIGIALLYLSPLIVRATIEDRKSVV